MSASGSEPGVRRVARPLEPVLLEAPDRVDVAELVDEENAAAAAGSHGRAPRRRARAGARDAGREGSRRGRSRRTGTAAPPRRRWRTCSSAERLPAPPPRSPPTRRPRRPRRRAAPARTRARPSRSRRRARARRPRAGRAGAGAAPRARRAARPGAPGGARRGRLIPRLADAPARKTCGSRRRARSRSSPPRGHARSSVDAVADQRDRRPALRPVGQAHRHRVHRDRPHDRRPRRRRRATSVPVRSRRNPSA